MRGAGDGIGESDGCRCGDGDLVWCIEELLERLVHVSQELLRGVVLFDEGGFDSGEVVAEVLKKIWG